MGDWSIESIAVSRDQTKIAYGDYQGLVEILDVPNFSTIATFDCGRTGNVAFAGDIFYIKSYGQKGLWRSIPKGKSYPIPDKILSDRGLLSAYPTPDEKWLVINSGSEILRMHL